MIRRVKNSNPKLKGDAFEYVDCNNVCLILESSLDRAVSVMKNQDFAITAAFHATITKQENIMRNRVLRHQLTLIDSGIYQLVGHWQKAHLEKEQDDNCSGILNHAELLYLIIRENNISAEDFKNSVENALTISDDAEDPAIIKNTDGIFTLNIKGELKK